MPKEKSKAPAGSTMDRILNIRSEIDKLIESTDKGLLAASEISKAEFTKLSRVKESLMLARLRIMLQI